MEPSMMLEQNSNNSNINNNINSNNNTYDNTIAKLREEFTRIIFPISHCGGQHELA